MLECINQDACTWYSGRVGEIHTAQKMKFSIQGLFIFYVVTKEGVFKIYHVSFYNIIKHIICLQPLVV